MDESIDIDMKRQQVLQELMQFMTWNAQRAHADPTFTNRVKQRVFEAERVNVYDLDAAACDLYLGRIRALPDFR